MHTGRFFALRTVKSGLLIRLKKFSLVRGGGDVSIVTRLSLNRICLSTSLWCGHTRADLVMVTGQSQLSGSVTVTCIFCLVAFVWLPVRPCWPLLVSTVRGALLCSGDTVGQ